MTYSNTRDFLIGFDRVIGQLERSFDVNQKTLKYPPHDVIKRGEYEYEVVLAIAGFSKDEVTITVKDRELQIVGEICDKTDEEYIYKGISQRNFVKKFTLFDNVVVEGATFVDGLLRIKLKHNLPEEQKPVTITIS